MYGKSVPEMTAKINFATLGAFFSKLQKSLTNLTVITTKFTRARHYRTIFYKYCSAWTSWTAYSSWQNRYDSELNEYIFLSSQWYNLSTTIFAIFWPRLHGCLCRRSLCLVRRRFDVVQFHRVISTSTNYVLSWLRYAHVGLCRS